MNLLTGLPENKTNRYKIDFKLETVGSSIGCNYPKRNGDKLVNFWGKSKIPFKSLPSVSSNIFWKISKTERLIKKHLVFHRTTFRFSRIKTTLLKLQCEPINSGLTTKKRVWKLKIFTSTTFVEWEVPLLQNNVPEKRTSCQSWEIASEGLKNFVLSIKAFPIHQNRKGRFTIN